MKPPTKKQPQITVPMTPELYQQLKAATAQADIPMANWCRDAIRTKLEAMQ